MTEQHDHQCGCHGAASSAVTQSLSELDFERGVWSAAMDGEQGRVNKYLTGGGDPNATDSSGYTALHYAARSGHIEICRLLLDHRASVNSQTRSGGATPLHRTAYQGHVGVTRLLLDRGSDVRLVDSDGKTALHKAAERGQMEVAKLLVTKDSRLVQCVDNRGKSSVDYVPESKQELKLLLQLT